VQEYILLLFDDFIQNWNLWTVYFVFPTSNLVRTCSGDVELYADGHTGTVEQVDAVLQLFVKI